MIRGFGGRAASRNVMLRVIEEQLNRLRHTVRHRAGAGEVRSILVTSAVDSEGKTTVATGLARSFARSLDHWALLLETDLRRPAIARLLDLPPSPGIAGHICEGVPLADVIQRTDLPKLSVIAAGRRGQDAANIVASAPMRRAAEELRGRYPDRVIVIDAPPVLATPEPLALADFADGVVVVVRADRTPRSLVRQAIAVLPREKLLGVVLNGVSLGLQERRYYRTYYPTAEAEPPAAPEGAGA
jgi:capsular exopolysaccharide synthesis family protein